MRLTVIGIFAAALLAVAGSAFAAEPAANAKKPECAVNTEFHTRMVYTNTGTYASQFKIPGQTVDMACGYATDVGTFYGDVWSYIPWGKYTDGGEVDYRAGWKQQIGSVGLDVSAALYNFHLLNAGTFNTLDLRGKISYDFFSPKDPTIFQVYGMGDFTHSYDTLGDDFSAVAGLYAGYKITPKLEVGTGAEMWHHSLSSKTVFSIGPKVVYHLWPKVDLYAKGAFTHGSVVPGDPQQNKREVLGGLTIKF